jgi:hypothetical protein
MQIPEASDQPPNGAHSRKRCRARPMPRRERLVTSTYSVAACAPFNHLTTQSSNRGLIVTQPGNTLSHGSSSEERRVLRQHPKNIVLGWFYGCFVCERLHQFFTLGVCHFALQSSAFPPCCSGPLVRRRPEFRWCYICKGMIGGFARNRHA